MSYRYEFVAPYKANTSLIGFNMVTQKANLAALLRARDTDTVVISAPFALQQSVPSGQNPLGVTLRLPVYSDGPTPTTPNQRRAREIGALAIGIRLQPLVESALSGPVLDGFRVRIYDATAGAHPFYDSAAPAAAGIPMQQRRLDIGGRQWRIEMLPRPQPLELGRLQALLAGGGTISLLLAALAWSLASTRGRAESLGEQMSQRYRESELRFRALNELLPALDDFRPQLLLISAGFDAHMRDPLADLMLETEDFGWLTRQLREVAERHAAGRIVSMLEGGYDLDALRECTVVHVDALR